MAYATILFENPKTGKRRYAPVGFSWTTLFFGFLPAVTRSDWKWAVIIFFLAGATAYTSTFVFMFIYNRLYIKDLVLDGFLAHQPDSMDTIATISKRLGFDIPVFPDQTIV